MPRHEVRWERMLPHELEAAFSATPAVYFTYGLCEPHGPQNALGLDGLKAHGLAVKAAKRHGGIVAPADFWHVHELGGYAIWAEREIGEARPWLTAVPPWVHFKNVCYHVRAAEVLGFHAAILLTGHYGPNYLDLRTLVGWLQRLTRMRIYGLPDFEANPGFPGDGADVSALGPGALLRRSVAPRAGTARRAVRSRSRRRRSESRSGTADDRRPGRLAGSQDARAPRRLRS
jgi:creatinine amidohydrolase